MRKILLALFILHAGFASAQNVSVKGKISDTLEKKELQNAVVSLIKKSDSSLYKFARTNNKGEFTITNVAAGNYNLLVSFPKFADYVDAIEVKDADVQLGTLALTQKAQLLKEVVIRSGQAIRIKGDTTEFVADSFAVKEGATVEDLLKKLPGFQVDAKGNITAQGQRVQKVLVDGEEFFGDDPTMATKNIGAKAVDKVQVFDTKTEQQQLTGVGTGNEGKTVNIKLKEDKKKGAFGNFYAGTDFQKYLDAKALYNRFIGKEKISVYGTKTNLNTGSLNWEDRRRLGIENDSEYDEISGYYFSFGNNDEFNDWNLRGLPDAYTAGGLYINKWNKDKNNLNTSYRYNRLGTRNDRSVLSQTILPNGLIYKDQNTKTRGLNQQHTANNKYEWKIDSLASLKLTTVVTQKTTTSFSDLFEQSSDENRALLNKNDQEKDNKTERLQVDNQLTYRQAFNKKNRLLILTLRQSHIEDDNTGMLKANTEFYKSGVLDSTGITDQLKKFDGVSNTLGSKLTFSEPLSLKWNLVVDYAYNNNNSSSNRNTFVKSNNGKYETLDPIFSNNFDMVATSHSSMVAARYMGKKARFGFGSGLSSVQLNLNNLDSKQKNTYNFLNFTPQAQFNYSFKQQTNFSFNYRGTTRQPRIDQLQPIRDNNDQLNVFVGNPNLGVGFNHGVNMFFGSYKVLKATGLWLSANYNLLENAITNFSAIDKQRGRSVYTPVNTNGMSNWNFWGEWSRGEGDKKWRRTAGLNGNGGRNINFVNTRNLSFDSADKAKNDYANIELTIGIGYEVNEKYSFHLRPKVGYNSSKSSLQTSIDNNYFVYGGTANGYVMLPGKIEVFTDVNLDLRQKIAAFDRNTNIIQWNATVSRKFLKDKSGKISLVANDILDQNKGFNRVINSNFVSDERFLRVSQYFLLRLEWSFNKAPGAAPSK